MSRNMKDANCFLFDQIKQKFDQDENFNDNDDILNKVRYVQGNKSDTDWLINSKVRDAYQINQTIRYGLLNYQNNDYYFVTGLRNPKKVPEGLVSLELNPGIFVTLISEIKLPILETISTIKIEEEILYQYVGSDKYKGHLITDLIPIFPNIFIFEITQDYTGKIEFIHQFFATLLSNNSEYIYLKFEKDTLDSLLQLSKIDSNILAYENIVHALLSSHFKYSFLDIYRTIEQLYQIIYIEETYNELNNENLGYLTRTKLLETIDKYLSWKPQERSSLSKIFSGTPENYKEKIFSFFDFITDNKDDKISSQLYDIRCNIVHLKTSQKQIIYTDDNWNILIEGLANIIRYWYDRFSNFQ